MRVQAIMHKIDDSVTPEANLKEAAIFMRDHHFGFTPVSKKEQLVGVITDRDITVRAAANGIDMENSFVKDFMTKEVIVCYEDMDLSEAVKLMKENQLQRLTVLNNKKEKHIVGVLSLNDIAKNCDDKTLVWEVACCRSEML